MNILFVFGGIFMLNFIKPIALSAMITFAFVTMINAATANARHAKTQEEVDLYIQAVQESEEQREKYWQDAVAQLEQNKASHFAETFTLCKLGDSRLYTSDESVPEIETLSSKGFGEISFAEMYSVQVNKSYNIPTEFYYDILPETMYPLVEGVCRLEETQEISSMFLLAVAATETGWGTTFYENGSNNWFNWTVDAVNYQWFDSATDCAEYTGEMFPKKFFNREFYAQFGQNLDDDIFTVPEVNTRYAINYDYTVNWLWSDVVCEIMYNFNTRYQTWETNNL
jgi:hypothetical protein